MKKFYSIFFLLVIVTLFFVNVPTVKAIFDFEEAGKCTCNIYEDDTNNLLYIKDFVSLEKNCPESDLKKGLQYYCTWEVNSASDYVMGVLGEVEVLSLVGINNEPTTLDVNKEKQVVDNTKGVCTCGLVNPVGEVVGSGEVNLSKEKCVNFTKDKVGDFECSWKDAVTKGAETGSTNSNLLGSVENISDLNQLGYKNIQSLIGGFIKTAMGVMGSIALIMIIYGGFLVMLSSGEADKISKGTNILVWSTLGLVVIFASYLMVDFVFEAFR